MTHHAQALITRLSALTDEWDRYADELKRMGWNDTRVRSYSVRMCASELREAIAKFRAEQLS